MKNISQTLNQNMNTTVDKVISVYTILPKNQFTHKKLKIGDLQRYSNTHQHFYFDTVQLELVAANPRSHQIQESFHSALFPE